MSRAFEALRLQPEHTMAKDLTELYWIEELLPQEHSRKRMFGGFSFYVEEKLILVIFESSGNKEYRGKKFPFEIWNGCMFPAEKEHHATILKMFPFLLNHPVLPKWLYLPAESEDFEVQAQELLRELRKRNPLFGSVPKARSGQSAPPKSRIEKIDRIDTRKPRMFSDESAVEKLQKARVISDLKNLGPETEKAFLKAGIKTPQQFMKLGWKKSMVLLCKSNPKNNHSIFAYALIGALENKVWNRISEEDKAAARAFMKSLREKPKPALNKAKPVPRNLKRASKKIRKKK